MPARPWKKTLLRLLLLAFLVTASVTAAVYLIFIGHEPRPLKPTDGPSRFQTPELFDQKKSAPAPSQPQITVHPKTVPASELTAKKAVTTPAQNKSPAAEQAITAPVQTLAPTAPIKPAPPSPTLTQVAIIIDDMGYQKAIGESLLALDLDLTFAFLPQAPYSRSMAEEASRRNRDILLHQPLEPQDPQWKLGPGAITTGMTGRQMETVLAANLADLPLAIGVNNHMGSFFLENKAATRILIRLIKDRDLFFVDSQTSSNALGFPIAKEIGMKAASRDIFLDNDNDEDSVNAQLAKLLQVADRKGSAIGIGHPKQATLAALRRFAANTHTAQVIGIRHLVH